MFYQFQIIASGADVRHVGKCPTDNMHQSNGMNAADVMQKTGSSPIPNDHTRDMHITP